MNIVGVDTNSHYLALTVMTGGKWAWSTLMPFDGPERKADHPKMPTNRNKQFENRSPLERLDIMADELDRWLRMGDGVPPHYAYIEEPPFVQSVKVFAELTAAVTLTRHIFRQHKVPVSLVNVSTWKRETTGNAKADKSEVKGWVLAHAGMPDGLTEDEYDAGCIAFRGAVAAGDVR